MPGNKVATRKAYGNALARLGPGNVNIVSLDGEVSNSTMAETFAKACPDRFFEMYIAEQNMADVGLGLATRGKIPFVSTFAAFLSRAFDQIRMAQYSDPNLKFVGSHAGVSIGWDGPSQMGLEDLAMFRTLGGGVVVYPADAVATERLVEELAKHNGIAYMRTTRESTPILYGPEEQFPLGGLKVLRHSDQDRATVVSAGITLFEALAAHDTPRKWALPSGSSIFTASSPSPRPPWPTLPGPRGRHHRGRPLPGGGHRRSGPSALATVSAPVYPGRHQKPKSGSPEKL